MALLAAVLAVSWGSILARLCDAGPLAVAFWRMTLSTLIVLPFALLPTPSLQPVLSGRIFALVAGSGLLLALHYATWISSLLYTSVASSVLLVSTQPLFGVVLSRIFLRETASARTVAAVLVSLAGTAVIGWGDLRMGASHWLGDLLALSGAAFAAGYLLIGRGVRERIGFAHYLARVYVSATIALATILIAAGQAGGAASRTDWHWLILMAVGPGVAGHGLLNWSVRRLRAYVVNAALLGEPILATVYAWLVFGEAPGGHVYLGGILVIVGLVWVFLEEGSPAGHGGPSGL